MTCHAARRLLAAEALGAFGSEGIRTLPGTRTLPRPPVNSALRVLVPEGGTEVSVNPKPEVKCPVTLKFNFVSCANVNTDSFALWEVEEV
mmetsp:Transcript_58393/g.135925  ORF Transcript_58393/g.135925 Transcript_58393/m.135925 type:complete len:90 (-) Transcript_58393:198-467(-)